MVDTANPIIIDQYYCDSPMPCPNQVVYSGPLFNYFKYFETSCRFYSLNSIVDLTDVCSSSHKRNIQRHYRNFCNKSSSASFLQQKHTMYRHNSEWHIFEADLRWAAWILLWKCQGNNMGNRKPSKLPSLNLFTCWRLNLVQITMNEKIDCINMKNVFWEENEDP